MAKNLDLAPGEPEIQTMKVLENSQFHWSTKTIISHYGYNRLGSSWAHSTQNFIGYKIKPKSFSFQQGMKEVEMNKCQHSQNLKLTRTIGFQAKFSHITDIFGNFFFFHHKVPDMQNIIQSIKVSVTNWNCEKRATSTTDILSKINDNQR